MADTTKAGLFYKAVQELRQNRSGLLPYIQADRRYPVLINDYLAEPGANLENEGDLSFQAFRDRHKATAIVFDENDAAQKAKAKDFYANIENNIYPEIDPAPKPLSVAELMAPLSGQKAAPDDLQVALRNKINPPKIEIPTIPAPIQAEPITGEFMTASFTMAQSEIHISSQGAEPDLQVSLEALLSSPVTVTALSDLAPPAAVVADALLVSPLSSLRGVMNVIAAQKSQKEPTPEMAEYTVKSGDSLDKILYAQYGKGLQGRNIAELRREIADLPANVDVLANNPKFLIHKGDKIHLPALIAEESESAPAPVPHARPLTFSVPGLQ